MCLYPELPANISGQLVEWIVIGEHRRIFSLDGQHAFVATDKPTDRCVDLTNFVDDGRDTMWLYTTSSFPLDGALLD